MFDQGIFGLDVSGYHAERLALSVPISREWLDIERTLLTGKWFDYRFLNPTAATYLFAHELTKAYRAAFKRNIDTERGEFVRPLPDDLFTAPARTVSGVWRARQVADAMGMPYGVYLERAYYWGTRYWRQRHLPRPTQLYSDLITDRAAIDWKEFQANKLYVAEHPNYQAKDYDQRVPALNDHREYLFEQLATRGNSPSIVAQLVGAGLLSVGDILSRLGQDALCETHLPAPSDYN